VTVADSRIDELRRRLERDPGSRLFAQLAEEYRKAGQHADAIRVARTGLAQHPSYPSARLTLGRALLDSGDAAGARVELEATLHEAPDNILASRFLGQALESLGELGPALVQLEKTLKMAPGDRQLAGQISALQSRLRAPQPGREDRAPSAPVAASRAAAPAQRPASPRPPEDDGEDAVALPATIRIHGAENRGFWDRKSGEPAPPGPAPREEHPSPAAAAVSTPTPPLAAAPETGWPADEADAAPTAPTIPVPLASGADAVGSGPVATRVVAVEETVFEAEAPLEAASEPPRPGGAASGPSEAGQSGGASPFPSPTLAELYLRQGVVDRAVEVYRQVLAETPENDRARSRLAEIESGPPGADARDARRKALERTIAGLEALLGVLQRRRA
jgi:tetratricopeptide (TPR) repeat protein